MPNRNKLRNFLAVIELGGKQYLVKEGEEFLVDKIDVKNLKIRPYLVILENKVLIGKPEVKNYICEVKVLKQVKSKKKIAFKYKPKTGYHRKKGSRTIYSFVRIEKIISKKK